MQWNLESREPQEAMHEQQLSTYLRTHGSTWSCLTANFYEPFTQQNSQIADQPPTLSIIAVAHKIFIMNLS